MDMESWPFPFASYPASYMCLRHHIGKPRFDRSPAWRGISSLFPCLSEGCSLQHGDPGGGGKGGSAFPPLYEDVFCTLGTPLEAHIIWDSSPCAAEDM